MIALKPAGSAASQSVEELELQVLHLQRQLTQAEETIRALQGGVADHDARKLVEDSLRLSEGRLELELADTRLLQGISSHLIHGDTIDSLYSKITEGAMLIMHSDFSTLQMYDPVKDKLKMLASCGLSQEGIDFWEWVGIEAGTTCAVAMRTGKRFMSSDMQHCEHVVGTPDHAAFIKADVKSAQSTPLYSRNGKLLGMISTHWKHSHIPSDRDLNLLDILARQAADLIERKGAQEILANADRRKDEFLATLAHELRNPLAPIRNALFIMRSNPQSKNAPELFDMMERQVTHLVRLIDDLLDVSRLSQGKIDLRINRITLQSAIADAVEACRPLVEENAHTLTLSLPETPVYINADKTRMAQVVSNLLNNAAKYTPHGGHITLALSIEDGRAVLSVTDSGVGIPTEMLPKVFDLFTQVDRSLDRAQGGLGIGLALVKQLLDMHDGTIDVFSGGIGKGSCFTVRLPLAVSEDADGTEFTKLSDGKAPAGAPSLRILVVDDNEPSAKTIGWMLELDGHEPKLAHNGAEALAVVDSFKPDAILLDIGLPGMNGYDLCRELRKNPRFKHTLMIAQTGWGQERDRRLAIEAGFDHHLVKPISPESLSKLLEPQLA